MFMIIHKQEYTYYILLFHNINVILLAPLFFGPLRDIDMLIYNLIHTYSNEWNVLTHQESLHPYDVAYIVGFKSSHTLTLDSYAWKSFEIRSLYSEAMI